MAKAQNTAGYLANGLEKWLECLFWIDLRAEQPRYKRGLLSWLEGCPGSDAQSLGVRRHSGEPSEDAQGPLRPCALAERFQASCEGFAWPEA